MQTLLIIQNPRSALFYYGFGSIIYSILFTSLYYIYFYFHEKEDRQHLFRIKSLKDLIIKPTSPFIDDQILDEIFKSFKKQISIRMLTEGTKYLITMFSLISYEEQGIYSIISLIGIAFLRLISPIIDQIFSSIQSQSKQTSILNGLNLLDKLIRLWIILSVLFVVLIVPYSSTILSIYLGERLWKNSSLIFYLIEIFFNGIYIFQESFLQSMVSNEQKNSSENFSIFFSFIFFIFSFIFIRLFGMCGIILINSFHLIGRILINNSSINRLTNGRKWFKSSSYFSSDYLFFVFILFILLNLSRVLIENSFGEFFFVIGFILIIICLTLNEEKELIHYFYCIHKLNQFHLF